MNRRDLTLLKIERIANSVKIDTILITYRDIPYVRFTKIHRNFKLT